MAELVRVSIRVVGRRGCPVVSAAIKFNDTVSGSGRRHPERMKRLKFIEVELPVAIADGSDGLSFVVVEYEGVRVEAIRLDFC